MSRQRKKVRSTGSSAACRSMNRPIPSQSASSEVERNSTLVFSGGCSRERPGDRELRDQPVPLSLAPGTTSRAPMCAMNAAAFRRRRPCRGRSVRGCRAARRAATSAGPPTTGHISGGLVSLCSKTQGALLGDGLGDRGVEEEGRVGGVVVRDEDDRPLGVRRAELGEHVVAAALRAAAAGTAAGPAAARRRSGRRRPRRSPRRAAARRARRAAPRGRRERRRRPAGRSATRRCRWPPAPPRSGRARPASSQSRSASHSARPRSPSEAERRSKAQSSSRRSRIQAASGGVESRLGASVAIRKATRVRPRAVRSGEPAPAA